MRAIGIIGRRVLARSVRPAPNRPTPAWITSQLRARRLAEATGDYEAAIARELAVRGEAARLYRTQGPSEDARYAALVHLRAEAARTAAGNTLFELHAHHSVPA
ncbi:hypothetical protein NE857_03445 [Nocardiopsis exhalans]|uniref:Uncharacterized protein n=1 Tax=Nocardiopsis exhalans TaxID=163604 RepID=A0ABY5DBH1_9ACTN|nr:hypothetical protein [Nocardiopsis exhalans]USY20725.1 hypothetical protein NE857_03445 [Nocardiopsis exhalans]